MTKNIEHLIISPHCDDAMLSLGGHILSSNKTSVKVVTLFGTCAWTALPGKYSTKQITHMNQIEEDRCLSAAGVSRSLYELPEALMRGYRKWNTKRLHADDQLLATKITKILQEETRYVRNVYFPLAPGGHVDHILVRNQIDALYTALELANINIYAYEDLPYSWYGGLDESHADLRKKYNLTPYIKDISVHIDQKINLLKMYESQLVDTDLSKVKDYAKSLISSGYGERVWHIQKHK